MATLEKIAVELRAMVTGLEQAQARSAVAETKVLEVTQRIQAAGFLGIAQALVRVKTAVGEVRARLTTTATNTGEASRPVSAAPREVSPEQAIVVLTPASEKLLTATQGTAATIEKVTETQKIIAAVLKGGQPQQLLALMESIKQTLIVVAQHAQGARREMDETLAEVRRAGQYDRQGQQQNDQSDKDRKDGSGEQRDGDRSPSGEAAA
jgi:hypothetical protein